jgi:hypothetical protein
VKSSAEWWTWSRIPGNRPPNIPASPRTVYEEWNGWGDFLGTGKRHATRSKCLPFEEARAFARSLGLASATEWTGWCKSDKRLLTMPTNPHIVYKESWVSWRDWLGNKKKEFLPFKEAREYARSLRLKSQKEWARDRPTNILSNPRQYPEFVSWPDFLGNDSCRLKKQGRMSEVSD